MKPVQRLALLLFGLSVAWSAVCWRETQRDDFGVAWCEAPWEDVLVEWRVVLVHIVLAVASIGLLKGREPACAIWCIVGSIWTAYAVFFGALNCALTVSGWWALFLTALARLAWVPVLGTLVLTRPRVRALFES